mmetsp:Transcript_62069/g.161243  ORF Transcript_62069/g.161243 Transcript_62069/m.161243 type:complete len:203 (+) Transcript_62069:994-1602(+)
MPTTRFSAPCWRSRRCTPPWRGTRASRLERWTSGMLCCQSTRLSTRALVWSTRVVPPTSGLSPQRVSPILHPEPGCSRAISTLVAPQSNLRTRVVRMARRRERPLLRSLEQPGRVFSVSSSALAGEPLPRRGRICAPSPHDRHRAPRAAARCCGRHPPSLRQLVYPSPAAASGPLAAPSGRRPACAADAPRPPPGRVAPPSQ